MEALRFGKCSLVTNERRLNYGDVCRHQLNHMMRANNTGNGTKQIHASFVVMQRAQPHHFCDVILPNSHITNPFKSEHKSQWRDGLKKIPSCSF